MKCQLCNNEVKNYLSLTMHLRRSHKNISLQDYYDQFIIDDINNSFCICDRKKKFTSLEKGYAKTCGDKNCINTLKSITAKQTFLKNWVYLCTTII